jgi:hypothetical protein
MFEYKKLLTGKCEFNYDYSGISGFMKLKKDPKGEDLHKKNLIFRGETLHYTEWAYCLVLAVGKDCKMF